MGPGHGGAGLKRFLVSAALLLPFGAQAESVEDKYPGDWNWEYNTAISASLAQAKVKGCGIIRYRVSRDSSSEFLVYCSNDNENWKAYLVWPNINKVLGPYQPDPSLP